MLNIKKIIPFIIFAFLACEPEVEPETVTPKSYLPAYPGSFWDYTNGERVLTSPSYELHSYEIDVSSTEKTENKYVSFYNNQYLYEYSVFQGSTVFPLKKLLQETIGEWEVNIINNSPLMREVISDSDSLVIPFPPFLNPVDCVFRDVIVVVEYIDSLGVNRWNIKEYYADSVGLIKVEVNDPFESDTTKTPTLLKQIQGYYINY